MRSALTPCTCSAGGEDAAAVLRQLSEHCASLWPEFAWGDTNLCGQAPPPATYPADEAGPEAAFERRAPRFH
jgi:hypothetical protein